MTASFPVVASIDRQKLFEELYTTAFPSVARFVKHMGGDFEEASDIFQDALMIFYEKWVAGDLAVQVSFAAYLVGISKHLWIRKYNSDKPNVSLNLHEELIDVPAEETPTVALQKIVSMLERSGSKCMALLKAFYFDKLPMTRIKGMFGYASERSATVQKYKCIEKIRDEAKTKSWIYEDFFE